MRMSVSAFYYFRDIRFDLALGTSVVDAVVFDDLNAGLDDLYFPTDEFFADAFKITAALRTDTFIFIDIQINLLCRYAREFFGYVFRQ